jgi:anti-anti-sigma factor
MTSSDLASGIQLSAEGILLFSVPQTLDSVNAPKLKVPYQTALKEEISELQIDLGATTFMDSAGIGLLVSLYREIRSKQIPITISNAAGQPLSLIKSLQIDKAIELQ